MDCGIRHNDDKGQKNPHPSPLPKGEGVKQRNKKHTPPLFCSFVYKIHSKTTTKEQKTRGVRS
jgi:hypothetical protein